MLDSTMSVQPQNVMRTNPLLQRIRVPGESFTLPSRAIFYQEGVLSPDVTDGEIHIYPMTAIDELIMKTPDKLFSGDAIREVFSRCIPSVLKPGELSAKDVDFLLVCLRKVSYGNSFELTYTHTCENPEQHSYTFELSTFLRGSKSLNPVQTGATFSHSFENGQLIKFKPATYDDVVKIYQMEQGNARDDSMVPEEQLRQLLVSVSTLIESVDGTTDRDSILEWLEAIPISWLNELATAAKNTTDWGMSFDVKLTCNDCKEEVSVPTPLNPISFFM